MTLLLGPPGAGKTTLLLALAGKLDPDLKVHSLVSYFCLVQSIYLNDSFVLIISGVIISSSFFFSLQIYIMMTRLVGE